MPTRREFLATLATIGLAGTASAQFANQPDHVTITGYDDAKSDISQFQPLVDYSALSIEPSEVYAWRATSDQYDYDWYCYWHWFVGQDAPSEEASHLPDREPITVAVGSEGVDHVVYSQWHYSAGVDSDPTLYQDTHPAYRCVYPYHHFQPASTTAGQLLGLSDFTNEYDDWLVNGWPVNRRAVVDPPFAEQRGNWWSKEQQNDHWLAVQYHELNESLPFDIQNPFVIEADST